MSGDVVKIAQVSLLNARNCLEHRNYGRAFANFLIFLKLKPENASDIYSEFALATKEWCEQLESQNRLKDLFKIYDQACELFPSHDVVLNNIGAQLFRLGYIEEAAAYIRKSLSVNPNYLAARDNLENVCSHLVERWHFSMLNDKRRNVAFKFAIDKAVKCGYNTVLDIGTGTGILSLMSDFSGALEVTACDGSQAMVDVARDVLMANGAFHKVKLLHKHSTDLNIPSHIQSRVKLVVTETFDAGLFGEHIVSTLTHAWKNLISTSPMGTVIPCGATMYVCGIECETIRNQSRFLYPVLQNLDMSHIELLCSTGHVAEEPYTTENLAKISGGYKILTNIAELTRISFCNLYELESINKGKDWICDLFVKQHGRLDALAVWFDLHLDDTITIGTGADNHCCWEQAIFPITSIYRWQSHGHDGCHVKRKEKLRTYFHFEQDCLRLSKCQVHSDQLSQALAKTTIPHHTTDQKPTEAWMLPKSGTSMKECSVDCLPFRKRKVDSLTTEGETDDQDTQSALLHNQSVIADTSSSFDKEVICEERHYPQKDQDNDEHQILKDEFSSVILSGQGANESSALELDCAHEDLYNINDRTSCLDGIASFSNKPAGEFSVRLNKAHSSLAGQDDIPTQCIYNTQLQPDTGPEVTASEDTQSSNTFTVTDNELENSNIDIDVEMEKCSLNKSTSYYFDSEINPWQLSACSTQSTCITQINLKESSCKMLGKCEGTPADDIVFGISSQEQTEIPKLSCFAGQVEIEYVNDIQLNKQYCQILEQFKEQNSSKFLSLLYITPRLSFLGIQAAKIGYNRVTMATAAEHHETLQQVAELNGCTQEQLILTELCDLNDLDMTVDLIVCDVVEPCGALRQQALEDLMYHRLASLTRGGLLLPIEVKVQGLFIESEELDNISHVTDNDKTLGFHIAEFINVFQMRNHMNIDLTTLTYSKLTDVHELLTIDLNDVSIETPTDYLDQTVQKKLEVIGSGRVTALVYWFELRLNKDTVISTLDSRYHWKQAGIIMKDDVSVSIGQQLVAKVKLQNSCLDVQIKQPRT